MSAGPTAGAPRHGGRSRFGCFNPLVRGLYQYPCPARLSESDDEPQGVHPQIRVRESNPASRLQKPLSWSTRRTRKTMLTHYLELLRHSVGGTGIEPASIRLRVCCVTLTPTPEGQ